MIGYFKFAAQKLNGTEIIQWIDGDTSHLVWLIRGRLEPVFPQHPAGDGHDRYLLYMPVGEDIVRILIEGHNFL